VGYFPSFCGWIMMKVLARQSWYFMKLRASYGTLGNDQIPNNGYVSQLSGEATYVGTL
jgi:hypothetical protein